jgi:hypothetical protein
MEAMERLRRAEEEAAEFIVAVEAQRFAAHHHHQQQRGTLSLTGGHPTPETRGGGCTLGMVTSVGRLPDLAALQRRLQQVCTPTNRRTRKAWCPVMCLDPDQGTDDPRGRCVECASQVDREHEHVTAALLAASARAADAIAPNAHSAQITAHRHSAAAEETEAGAGGRRVSGMDRFRMALDDARTELLSDERAPLALPSPSSSSSSSSAAVVVAPTTVALNPSATSAVAAVSLGGVAARRRRGGLGSLRARLKIEDSP